MTPAGRLVVHAVETALADVRAERDQAHALLALVLDAVTGRPAPDGTSIAYLTPELVAEIRRATQPTQAAQAS